MEEIVRLRGHHILCLLGFRGLGYSEEFVKNMTRVHERVFSGGTAIEFVSGPDDICSACPRLQDGQCSVERPSRIDEKDAAILKLLGIESGLRLSCEETYKRVADTFTPEDLSHICSRCRWLELGYCTAGLRHISDS